MDRLVVGVATRWQQRAMARAMGSESSSAPRSGQDQHQQDLFRGIGHRGEASDEKTANAITLVSRLVISSAVGSGLPIKSLRKPDSISLPDGPGRIAWTGATWTS